MQLLPTAYHDKPALIHLIPLPKNKWIRKMRANTRL